MFMLSIESNHQHYPSLGLDEGVRMLHYNGIYLGGGDWPAVLSHVQLPAVDDIRYLLGAKATAPLGKDVQYGFLYLHFQSLDEMVTNSTFPSIYSAKTSTAGLPPGILQLPQPPHAGALQWKRSLI